MWQGGGSNLSDNGGGDDTEPIKVQFSIKINKLVYNVPVLIQLCQNDEDAKNNEINNGTTVSSSMYLKVDEDTHSVSVDWKCLVENEDPTTANTTNEWWWILEKDPRERGIIYIRSCVQKQYGQCYLGAPNRNKKLYLYTSKTKYTKWSIQSMLPLSS